MRGLLAFVLLSLAACEFEKIQIPVPPARVALHGVLSASAPTQVVLLERTRNGSVTVYGTPFDPSDLVTSGHGIAEAGAHVQLITPEGDTIEAVEDALVRDDQKGQGVYRIPLAGSALERGAEYHLLVHTLPGEVLSARTSVPDGVPAMSATSRVFDRSRDTAVISWLPSANARGYFVRIESPFGPNYFFTESTTVRLPASVRNTQATGLPHLFVPGFPQAVTVSAVDSNYYDWFRTHNNTLSGEGLISRVDGGVGVFGSLVRLHYETFNVVAPQTAPAEGVFRLVGDLNDFMSAPNQTLVLYVEARSARSDQPDALSGRYEKVPKLGAVGCQTCGLLGTVKGNQVTLDFLEDWFANDTADVFTGEIRGDTIVGTYRFLGPFKYVKDQ